MTPFVKNSELTPFMTPFTLMERAALAKMGLDCFRNAIQIVDFYHAMERAGKVLVASLGSKEHPEYKARLSGPQRALGQIPSRSGRRGTGVLREQCPAHAIWHLPPPRLL